MSTAARLLVLFVGAAASLAALFGVTTTPAWARFSAVAPTASASYSSATLTPPTGLKVTTNCSNPLAPTATLSWTPSTMAGEATGYVRTYTATTRSGQTTTGQASGTILPTATSVTFSMTPLTTYTTSLATALHSWTASSAFTASFECI